MSTFSSAKITPQILHLTSKTGILSHIRQLLNNQPFSMKQGPRWLLNQVKILNNKLTSKLTLSILSSNEVQEACKVTSATWPASETMKTLSDLATG